MIQQLTTSAIMMTSLRHRTFLFLLLVAILFLQTSSFMIQPPASRVATRLFEIKEPPQTMKATDIRKELESYGISTKAFLEKKELVAALEKARAEGRAPKMNAKSATASTSAANGEATPSSASRQEKLEKELNRANSMKVGELKKALQDIGISTKSFFEKTEFVKAYAEAMVDGVPKKKASTGGGAQQTKEEYDPSYRDVVMQKFDPRQLLSSPVIDIRLGR